MPKEPEPTGGAPRWDRTDWIIALLSILFAVTIVVVASVAAPLEGCR